MVEEIYKFLDYSYFMRHKAEIKRRLLQTQQMQEIKIAVLCGSTFGIIEEFLEIFLLNCGIKPHFLIGEYNRYLEESCFTNHALDEFKPDIIFMHITNKNLLCCVGNNTFSDQTLEEERRRFVQMWEALETQYHSIIIQNNFEYFLYRMIGNAARTREDGIIRYVDVMNEFISSYMRCHKNFFINDIHYLSAYMGLKAWEDERMWNLYKYPISMAAAPRYAYNIAALIKSIFGKNKKAIITDLDNTLWGGLIGEVGMENLQLGNETPQGESYELVHRYLKYLSQHGVLLNICSKNEYKTGINGFQSSKSILKENDFVVKKINWNNKCDNIRDILQELNLPQEAAVFIDDNFVECDSVRSMLPSVEVLQATGTRRLLDKMDVLSLFEGDGATQEDSLRVKYYQDNSMRNDARRQYKDYNEYLNALQMVCYVDTIHENNIQRAVQLINKTSQFNFLARKYTLEEIEVVCQVPNIQTFALELEDKFGSNGIVSLSVVRFEEGEAYIEDWVMSCRVFERKLEMVMMKLICECCLKNGIFQLHGYYHKTEKNQKIAHFFDSFGFEKVNDCNKMWADEWICKDIDDLLKKCDIGNIVVKEKST